MLILKNNSELNDLIENNSIAIIYFSGSKCGACEVIKTKVENMIENFPKIKSGEIDAEIHLEIAAKYNVFSLPIMLLFIEGKESIRLGRNLDLLELKEKLERYYKIIFK